MIRATEANLAKVTDNMIVIPGHVRLATNPSSPSAVTCWLALGRKWRLSRNKANRSTRLSQQSLQPPQTQSGATALGALKTSSETFSRAFDADCSRVTGDPSPIWL
jgi:hypothetical protein